jgi:hypothetical protein
MLPGVPDEGSFAELAERHLGPVLVPAGFAPGQWGEGAGYTSMTFVVDESGARSVAPGKLRPPVVASGTQSGTYCTSAQDYVRRYAHLAAGRADTSAADHPHACLDIVVAGSLGSGVDDVRVEGESLAHLLRDLGRRADADLVDEALARSDPATALAAIGGVLARLYPADGR